MGTNKEQAKANKAQAKANQTALKHFPKAKLAKAFATMAETTEHAEHAGEAKANAALSVVVAAHEFRAANADATMETVITGWRDHGKVLAMELALAGNRFAELTEAKDDKPATAKLTGYGANVMSIAKGALQFDVVPDADSSYRDVRKAVEAKRAEAKRESDPDAALLADAKAAAIESWDELRTAVFETGDHDLINGLTATLANMLSDFNAAQAEQERLEAEAKPDAEAEAEANADADAEAKAA